MRDFFRYWLGRMDDLESLLYMCGYRGKLLEHEYALRRRIMRGRRW